MDSTGWKPRSSTVVSKTLGPVRDAVSIVLGVLRGEPFEYDDDTWSGTRQLRRCMLATLMQKVLAGADSRCRELRWRNWVSRRMRSAGDLL